MHATYAHKVGRYDKFGWKGGERGKPWMNMGWAMLTLMASFSLAVLLAASQSRKDSQTHAERCDCSEPDIDDDVY